MYLVTVTYGHPIDPDAFDQHYREVHLSLVGALPGVRTLAVGHCEGLDGNPPSAYVQAVLTFDSRDDAGQALTSEAGQAAAADIAGFATGGASMTFTAVDHPA